MFGPCKSEPSVLIEELDYKFIGDCQDGTKLENILNVLRSGEEGQFPDLTKFAEKHLQSVKPQSKLLRIDTSGQSSGANAVTRDEREAVATEMDDWQQEIKKLDSVLSSSTSRNTPSDNLPPVRETGGQDQQSMADINTRNDATHVTAPTDDLPERELENLAIVEKLKGNDAFRIGDYSEALNYYSRSLSVLPITAVYNNRAAVYLKLKRYDDAMEDSKLVLKKEPNNVKALLRLAISLEETGKMEKAKDTLERLLSVEPSNRRAKELLEELKSKTILPPDQAQSKEDITRLNSNEKEDVSQSNDEKSQRKGRRLNIVEVDSIEEVDKNSKELNCHHNKSLRTTETKTCNVQSDTQQAECAATTKELPSHVIKLKDDGNRYFKGGKYAEAAQSYTKAVDAIQDKHGVYHSADVAVLYSNRAAAQLKIGKSRECVEDATRSIEIYPTTKAFMRRASAHETLERYGHSYVDNHAVLKMDPSALASQQALSRLGNALRQQHGSTWRDKLPPSISLKSHVGSLIGQGNPIVPKKQLKSPVVELQEDRPTVEDFATLKQKGNGFVKQGKYEEAVKCYTSCIKLDNKETSAFTNRALCYIKLNKPNEATADCECALKVEPQNVKALFRRAQSKKILKQYKECLADLKRLLAIESTNAAAKSLFDSTKELYRQELTRLRSPKK